MIRAAVLSITMLVATQALAETIVVNGTERTFTAYVPAKTPAPLVLILHGNTQQGADMQTRSSWPDTAQREQFIAIYPDGLNRAWADLRGGTDVVGRKPPAGTDDVAGLMALVDKYVRDGKADPKRIYVTGVSNGGAMAMSLACREPKTFAAAASVIMTFTPAMAEACRPSQPIPMLLMNGTADTLVAYEGGKSTSQYALPNVWSTEQTIAFWRKANGCEAGNGASTDLPDRNTDDGSTVTRIDSRCPSGRDVVLYRINRGGHRMPGKGSDAKNTRIADSILGPQNHDIDGPEVIWAFFKGFTR